MCKGKESCKECASKAKVGCKPCQDYGKNYGKEKVSGVGKAAEFPLQQTKGAVAGVGTGYLLAIIGKKYPESMIGDALTRAGIQAGGGLATVLFTDDDAYKSFGVGLIGSAVIPLAEKIGISGAISGVERITNKVSGFTRNLRNNVKLAGLKRSGKQAISEGAKVFIPSVLSAGRGIGGAELRRRI